MKNICLLLEGVAGLYYSSLWSGIADSAKKKNCSITCFAGGALRVSPQNPYEVERNIIYNYIDTQKFDGLIISGTLKNFISKEEFAGFMARFKGLPTISLTPMLDNIPALLVDNSSGMRSLISHLVNDHQCSSFAFIGGPKGNIDADQRLDLFRQYLTQYGLESGDDRVIAGDYSRCGGYRATLELLKRGVKFDALLAANDETAFGAIEALQDNNIRVPEDTAVTGFDCIEESELTTPPLTTVRQPFYEIGENAVNLLISMIDGKKIPMRTILQTPLMIRQSCGCYTNPKHSLDSRTRTLTTIMQPSSNIERLKEQLAETLFSFISLEMTQSVDLEANDITDLASSFFDEIADVKSNVFLPTLNRIIRAATLSSEEHGSDVLQWQKILAILHKFTQGLDGAKQENADILLHEGYNLFGETAARQQAHKRLQAEQKAALLRSAGHSIANSFDIQSLTKTIFEEFPKLGISDFYLSLYDNETVEIDCEGNPFFPLSKPVLELHGCKMNIPPSDAPFPTKNIIQSGLKNSDAPSQLLVQPLHFKDEQQLGIAVFKDGPLTGYIYDILGEHLSGALQGALLMKKIQEQHRELEILRAKEHTRLEAIERELQIGRSIQESFLPESMPVVPGWESRALFLPAREVSGDFYDAYTLEDGRLAFIIADVSGKDVGAALFMSLIRSLIRAFSEYDADGTTNPLNAVEFTNRYIVNHHHTTKGRFMYATMFFAVIDPATGEVTYINAGHNPPAILNPKGGTARWLAPTGPAVGVGIKENLIYRQETLTLSLGEILLPYTDGVIEAKNEKGEFLKQARFAELIERPYTDLNELIDRINNTLTEHCAGAEPYDDITMMGIYRKPG